MQISHGSYPRCQLKEIVATRITWSLGRSAVNIDIEALSLNSCFKESNRFEETSPKHMHLDFSCLSMIHFYQTHSKNVWTLVAR